MAQSRRRTPLIPTVLTGSVTQGGADAFAVNTITTGLQALGTIAYRVVSMIVEWPTLPIAASANVELAISRTTKTAMPDVLDRDVVWMRKRQVKMTTSGAIAYDAIEVWTPDPNAEVGILIVEDPIYLLIDSNATSNAGVGKFNLAVEQIEISEVDRLTLLARNNL